MVEVDAAVPATVVADEALSEYWRPTRTPTPAAVPLVVSNATETGARPRVQSNVIVTGVAGAAAEPWNAVYVPKSSVGALAFVAMQRDERLTETVKPLLTVPAEAGIAEASASVAARMRNFAFMKD